MTATTANESDVAHAYELPHDHQKTVHADTGHTGPEHREAQARSSVAYPFHVIESLFKDRKMSSRWIVKPLA